LKQITRLPAMSGRLNSRVRARLLPGLFALLRLFGWHSPVGAPGRGAGGLFYGAQPRINVGWAAYCSRSSPERVPDLFSVEKSRSEANASAKLVRCVLRASI